VKRGESFLVDGLHGNGANLLVPVRLEQGFGVSAIGFVSTPVWPDISRWEEADGVSKPLEVAGPVVRGAAGFEEDGCRLLLSKEVREAGP
jgi:hypothetical protein